MKKVLTLLVCSLFTVSLVLPSALGLPPADPSDTAMRSIHADAIRADMGFLSDDLLEGRGTATRGHLIAARFMAAEFESMGLAPMGDSSTYFQNVPLRSARSDETNSSLTLTHEGKSRTLAYRKDYISSANLLHTESSVEAPVVYVGFGVTAPDQNYDDYQGVDTKGKIVGVIFGAPNFESSLKAHYSSFETKRNNAVAHGAIGILLLDDPVLESLYPFKERVRDRSRPTLRWLQIDGRPHAAFPQLKAGADLSLSATENLFAGGPHSAEEVFQAAKEGKPLSFDLPVTAKIRDVQKLENVSSPNVVAKLEGSDPLLKDQYLVYTAHLDHLGIGEPVKGDSIYNGALDNASGSAILLEVARAFSQMNPRPRRSILFVSVTGEEEGLLGSD